MDEAGAAIIHCMHCSLALTRIPYEISITQPTLVYSGQLGCNESADHPRLGDDGPVFESEAGYPNPVASDD